MHLSTARRSLAHAAVTSARVGSLQIGARSFLSPSELWLPVGIRNLGGARLDVAKHGILQLAISRDRKAHLRLQDEFIPSAVDRKAGLNHDRIPIR